MRSAATGASLSLGRIAPAQPVAEDRPEGQDDQRGDDDGPPELRVVEHQPAMPGGSPEVETPVERADEHRRVEHDRRREQVGPHVLPAPKLELELLFGDDVDDILRAEDHNHHSHEGRRDGEVVEANHVLTPLDSWVPDGTRCTVSTASGSCGSPTGNEVDYNIRVIKYQYQSVKPRLYTKLMLKLSKSLFNQPVMSLRAGAQVAVAVEPIINPHNLKIVGWWCNRGNTKPIVLLAENVREVMLNGLAIDDEDDLSDPHDLVRYHEVLEANFKLLDKPVRTKRHKLGKVSDYSYEDGMFIQKLYVSRPLRKVFTSDDTLLVDRDQIIEVTDQHILVSDTDIKATEEELAPTGAVATP